MIRLSLRSTVTLLALLALAGTAWSADRTPSPPGAEVYFIGLADHAKVHSPLVLRFGLKGMGIAPAGIVMENTGHHHLFIDTPVPTDTPPNDTKMTEKPQQTAAMVPPPLPPAKPDPPKAEPAFKPLPKPSPPARQPPRHVEEPANMAPRRARFPGPAATRDEYLAYMHSLIRQHYNLLPMAIVGDRRGATVIEFLVLDDGTIAMVKVRRSSGYPDIDRRVEEMIAAVGRFPPLPQWFQGPGMPFEFGFPFPDALRE